MPYKINNAIYTFNSGNDTQGHTDKDTKREGLGAWARN